MGTRHGYHTMTIRLCIQELIRRVDPAHRTLGRFFREEVAEPLGLDFYIGLPRQIPDERIATLEPLSWKRGVLALRYTPFAVTMRMIAPQLVPASLVCRHERRLERSTLPTMWSCPPGMVSGRRAQSREPTPRSPRVAPSLGSHRRRSPA